MSRGKKIAVFLTLAIAGFLAPLPLAAAGIQGTQVAVTSGAISLVSFVIAVGLLVKGLPENVQLGFSKDTMSVADQFRMGQELAKMGGPAEVETVVYTKSTGPYNPELSPTRYGYRPGSRFHTKEEIAEARRRVEQRKKQRENRWLGDISSSEEEKDSSDGEEQAT